MFIEKNHTEVNEQGFAQDKVCHLVQCIQMIFYIIYKLRIREKLGLNNLKGLRDFQVKDTQPKDV